MNGNGGWPIWTTLLAGAVGIVLAFAGIAGLAPWIFECLAFDPADNNSKVTATACSEIVRNNVLAVAGLFAGLVALVALHFNARRTHTDRLRLTNDTYVKAIEQLASEEIDVRIGAMYALARIAHEEQRYHWPVNETLAAYIRERAPWPPRPETATKGLDVIAQAIAAASDTIAKRMPSEPSTAATAEPRSAPTTFLTGAEPKTTEEPPRRPPTDIQTALTIIAHRAVQRQSWVKQAASWAARWPRRLWYLIKKPSDFRITGRIREIDLSHTDLSHADLWRGNLSSANLTGSRLIKALCGNAVLTDVNFYGADLTDAVLSYADLTGAKLGGADLNRTRFTHHPKDLGAKWDEADHPKNLCKIIIESE